MNKYIFLVLSCVMAIILCGSAAAASPTADFSADQTQGAAPLTVQFTDQSTGNPTEWYWDFDNDGDIDSTEQNPTYTFTSSGSHTITLLVKNADGTDYEKKYNYINVGPDLTTSIQLPTNPQTYQTYTVNYTVHNNGPGNVEVPFTAWIYCNGELFNKTTINSLASGASQTISFTWMPTTTGTHTFTARADPYGNITEYNENNNAATQSVSVAPSKPDLVTSIQAPENPEVGKSYSMSYTVTNNGGAAGSFTAWIYCNGKLLDKTVISSLASGASQTISFTWIPTTTGTNSFSARADVYGTVIESNERNNAATQSVTVLSKPDLVTSIQAPENPQVGQTYTMSYTVTNNGESTAGPFTAWIYYDGKLINKTVINGLAGGANQIITFDWTPTTIGTYTFSARSDIYATVIESNEQNNAATQSVTILSMPDLVTSIQAPENPQVGQTYTMSYTVTNNGQVAAGPFTAWIYYDGKLINKTVINGLGAGQNAVITFDWTPTTIGTYTFSARSDIYATVIESNEQNNAAIVEMTIA